MVATLIIILGLMSIVAWKLGDKLLLLISLAIIVVFVLLQEHLSEDKEWPKYNGD